MDRFSISLEIFSAIAYPTTPPAVIPAMDAKTGALGTHTAAKAPKAKPLVKALYIFTSSGLPNKSH